MVLEISFIVPGPPVAQPRLEQVWVGEKRIAFPPRTRSGAEHPVTAYKQAVALVASQAVAGCPGWREQMLMPMQMIVLFVMPRNLKQKQQKGHSQRDWYPGKPDGDNLLKATLDACKSIVFVDDSQVVACIWRKVLASTGELPRTEVSVCPVQADQLPG